MSIGDIMRERREAAGLMTQQVYRRGGPSTEYQQSGQFDCIKVHRLIDWCDAIGCNPNAVFAEIVAERKGGAT